MTSASRGPANPNTAPLPEVMPTEAEARAAQLESEEPVPSSPPPNVDLESPENVSQWLRELDVTRDQLEAAVRAVGTSGSDVEAYLTGRRSSSHPDL